jgi:hypothetical protein
MEGKSGWCLNFWGGGEPVARHRRTAPTGTVSTLGAPSGDLAIDPDGNLYLADYRHHIILTTIPTGVEFTTTTHAAAAADPALTAYPVKAD